ncbi:MAG: hypothetical protein EP330_26485 [Deltaproteobacteria bacterium]|nr:MAG: hypothetical protein EP330_26485 [Deltaproteobacteria bacterium]
MRALILLLLVGCAEERWPVDPTTGLRVRGLGPVPELEEWPENPSSEAKRELGIRLFNDIRLSGSGQTNCSTCHFAPTKFQSNTPFDLPDRSADTLEPVLPRNAPSLLNLVYAPVFRWDGGLGDDLAEQLVIPFAEANMDIAARLPAEEVHELDFEGAKPALHARLTEEIPGYVPLYEQAFGLDLRAGDAEQTWRLTGQALAIYMREVVSKDSRFDRWNAGEDGVELDDSELRGLELFVGEARCATCHGGPLFSDFAFHNVGTAVPDAMGDRADEGRYLVSGAEEDRGAFLTPTLRSAGRTSPYFHDASEIGIAGAIERHLTVEDPLHDPILHDVVLDEDQIEAIVDFVQTLDGAELSDATTELITDFP